MRAPFWEHARRDDALTVRWTGSERIGRVVRFALWYLPVAFLVATVAAPFIPDSLGGTPVVGGGSLSALGVVAITTAAWRSGCWRFDRNADAVYQGSIRRLALADVSRVLVRRHKRPGYPNGGVVFCLHLERQGTDPLLIGEMDQRDAQEVGTVLARFLSVRYSEW